MGYYINPRNQTKEQFLLEKGVPISSYNLQYFDFRSDKLPVCLVDNVIFTAAGILYNQKEIQAFTDPYDSRPKEFFLVKRSDLVDYYKE